MEKIERAPFPGEKATAEISPMVYTPRVSYMPAVPTRRDWFACMIYTALLVKYENYYSDEVLMEMAVKKAESLIKELDKEVK
jgi:hypothetical protein